MSSNIRKIDPDQYVLLSSLIAISLTQDISIDEMLFIGNFLSTLGTLIQTKAFQAQNLVAQEEIKKQILDLEEQVEKLKKQLF